MLQSRTAQAAAQLSMRLETEFVKLPLRFDADRLAAEVDAVAEEQWRPHPQGHPGNSALPILAAYGDPADEDTRGPMQPTPVLAQLPYLRQVLASLQAPIGRSRLMRLDGNAEATAHADVNYYWIERLRVHVPIVTTPGVRFVCGEREVHMAPGECWVFDTWRIHNVLNPDPTRRIHLVADTVGSAPLWELIGAGEAPFSTPPRPGAPARFVPWRVDAEVELATERSNQPVVMSPWEQSALLEPLVTEAASLPGQESATAELLALLQPLRQRWRALWAIHGTDPAGWDGFRDEMGALDALLGAWRGKIRLANRLDLAESLRHALVRSALNPRLASVQRELGPPAQPLRTGGEGESASSRSAGVGRAIPPLSTSGPEPVATSPPLVPGGRHLDLPRRFDRPVFLVSPPRSGSSLLFETLAQSPAAWTIGGESHGLIEGVPGLAPRHRGWESNRLLASDATSHVVERLTDTFFLNVRDRDGHRPAAGGEDLRLVEKTPKNALRVSFLAAAFPDARFVYLYRNPRETIASIYEAWRSGRFVTYPELPDWPGPPWSLLLVPGWRELAGRPLAEIAARQWATTTDVLLADLEALPPERWCVANYGRLVSEPQVEVERLCAFLGLPWDRQLEAPLPPSRHTLTPPERGKWRRQAAVLEPVFPLAAGTAERALEVFASRPGHAPLPLGDDDLAGELPPIGAPSLTASPEPARRATRAPAPSAAMRFPGPGTTSALRSVATPTFPDLLRRLGGSLLVSTYQSGKVVVVRADGDQLNTHFRSFASPMGIALDRGRLAIGTAREVWEYRNVPAATTRLEPAGKHDACFVPRACRVTGDVRVHELAFAGDELWLVATRFSALCTLDERHSFVPRWRPPFISALAPEDRCHLNGLGVVDGRVRFATALGRTDAPAGWREGKATGGVLIGVPDGDVVAAGLSMPHSPRWHAGRLWLLESGKGEIGIVDAAAGRVTPVARLPGFTRGLAFAGPVAFVGLSQVRESVFGGIPLADRLRDRVCGVWAVDTRNGAVLGFLRFEDAVQEIFDVAFLPGLRFPELVDPDSELAATTWVLPDDALAEVPTALRS